MPLDRLGQSVGPAPVAVGACASRGRHQSSDPSRGATERDNGSRVMGPAPVPVWGAVVHTPSPSPEGSERNRAIVGSETIQEGDRSGRDAR